MTDETIVPDDGEVVAAEDVEATEQETETDDAGLEVEAEADADLEAEADADDPDGDSEEDADADEETEEEPEVEAYEFNFNGDKLSVPKDAMPEDLATRVDQFVRTAEGATTRKMQDIAERAKSLEARESAAQKLASLQGDALNTYSRGLQVRNEIEQLQGVDLSALWQSDPDQARRVSDTLSAKQTEFQNITQQVSQQEAAFEQAQAEERARRIDEGKQAVEAKVNGFEREHLPEVLDYAVSQLGISREEAEATWALNPAVTLAVHKAAQFDKLQAKAAAKAKPKPAAKAKPIKSVRGTGGKAAPDLANMTMEQYARHMNRLEAQGR